MFENLNQSYPFNNNFRHNIKTIGFVSMGFVLIVLYFQPFGINFLKSVNDGYFVLAAGLLSAAVLFANTLILPGILPKVFDSSGWTVKKEMIWNLWLFSNLFVIFIILVWYVREIDFTDLPVFRTGALALLPLVLFNLINYNHSLKAKMVSVLDSGRQWFKEEKPPIINSEMRLTAENGKDIFICSFKDVLLFHSSGNYVEIFLKQNEAIRKKLFRQSLIYVEEYLKDFSDFKKCHRCWMINMQKIKGVTGTSKGYFIMVEGLDFKVPVSRNYNNSFKKYISV